MRTPDAALERAEDPDPEADRAPRGARWLVTGLFVALLVPGLIGFEAWPLTGWRLFSASRAETATRYVMEGVAADGSRRLVSPEELPLAYRHVEWPLRSASDASEEDGQALCRALVEAVAEVDPDIVELHLARDRQRLESVQGEWVVQHDLDIRHSCALETEQTGEDGP